jgi:hypothetical protein
MGREDVVYGREASFGEGGSTPGFQGKLLWGTGKKMRKEGRRKEEERRKKEGRRKEEGWRRRRKVR